MEEARALARKYRDPRVADQAFSEVRTDYRGEVFRSKGLRLGARTRRPVPIYVAALRERMLGFAATETGGAFPYLVTAERVAWIPLSSIKDMIAKGEIIGAAAQIGLLHVLAFG